MNSCPAINLAGETSVSGSLQGMDCLIGQAVEVGYNRLFGYNGAFTIVLTSLLTIYIALLAYGFLTGRTRLTMTMMSPRLVTLVLVLTFISVWPAYHAVFYGLFMNGPDEVASALLGQRGSAYMNFAAHLDGLFVRFSEIAKALSGGDGSVSTIMASKQMAAPLFMLSGILLLLSTLGALILTRLVLYLLLILGPVFIVMALFGQTRGLFNGWIKTTLSFALMPLLIILGGTGALMLFIPLLDTIASDPQGAATALQPILVLFLGSLIYCAFLLILMGVAASLVRDWQAALRDPADRGTSEGQRAVPLSGYTPQMAASINRAAHYASASDPLRADQLAQSLNVRVEQSAKTIVSSSAQTASSAASQGGQNRVQGLGQRFRPNPKSAPSSSHLTPQKIP